MYVIETRETFMCSQITHWHDPILKPVDINWVKVIWLIFDKIFFPSVQRMYNPGGDRTNLITSVRDYFIVSIHAWSAVLSLAKVGGNLIRDWNRKLCKYFFFTSKKS